MKKLEKYSMAFLLPDEEEMQQLEVNDLKDSVFKSVRTLGD